MNTYYMIYLGGQYIERVIQAYNKQEAYEQLSEDERAEYYLLSEAEYDQAFGSQDDEDDEDENAYYFYDDDDECGFNPYLGCYDYDE